MINSGVLKDTVQYIVEIVNDLRFALVMVFSPKIVSHNQITSLVPNKLSSITLDNHSG